MKAPTKLHGGKESELTRLKELWRQLSPDVRSYWQELFISKTKQEEIRSQILDTFKIELRFDKQLNAFRDWEMDQRERDLEAERQAEDERRALAENPNWSLDQAREEVLRRTYQRAMASGDFKMGLAAVDRDLKSKVVTMDREKLELLKRKAEQAENTDKVLSKADMTPEQRELAIREIYGRA